MGKTQDQDFAVKRKILLKVGLPILLSFTLFPLPSQAYHPQEGTVTATFGPFVNKTDYNGPMQEYKSYDPGFGLIAQGDINEKGSLEIAAIYLNKYYYREQEGLSLAEKTQLVQMNMGYRRWLGTYLSIALTFYSAYSMGEPQIVFSNLPSGTELTTSARDITEYGLDYSLQWEVWTQKEISFVIDGRYAMSFTNKTEEKGNHYGLLLGVKYLVQKKPN